MEQYGPARTRERSSTRTPASGAALAHADSAASASRGRVLGLDVVGRAHEAAVGADDERAAEDAHACRSGARAQTP